MTAGRGRPEFAPPGEPDTLRDPWAENMPRVSGRVCLAVPGEQPIPLEDDAARDVLASLSERARG